MLDVINPGAQHISLRGQRLRAHDVAIVTLLVALAGFTVFTLPRSQFGIVARSPTLAVAITIATLLIALGASYFALGEFLLYGRVSSLYVCLAFSVFAAAQFGVGLYPLLGHLQNVSQIPLGWGLERIAGGLLFVAASLQLGGTIPVFRRLRLSFIAVLVALGVGFLVAVWVYAGSRATSLTPAAAMQLAAAVLFAGASALFWRATRVYNRTWFVWLSMSLLIASFSEVQFALHEPHPGEVQAGDILWLVFFTGILLALAGEWSQNYRRLRWQARELEALHALMRAPVIENVPSLVQHVVRVVGDTFGTEARLVLADREVPFLQDLVEPGTNGSQPSGEIGEHVVVENGDEPVSRVALAVPLGTGSRRLGMLAILGTSGSEFTMHDVRLLRAFGAQATVLIERSMLYEEVAAGAVLQERSRLAREIHDGLAQHLAFLKMRVAWLQRSETVDKEQLHDIESVLETALIEARHAITTLRAQPQAASTIDAIADYAREFGQVSDTQVDVRIEEPLPDVGPKVRVELLRVVQEALNNVRKHARADSVDIEVVASGDGIQIDVADNGAGFDVTRTPEGHFGLEIMRERAESVGGTVEIDSRPGAGTRVRIWVPGMEAEKRMHGLVH